MAPEMLFHSTYDYRIDLWALGVLLYEMVHGFAPFRGDSVHAVKERMLRGSYELSASLSEFLKQLITEMLKFDPEERIALKDVLDHQWVREMQEVITGLAEQAEGSAQVHRLLNRLEERPLREGKGSAKKERHPTRNISFNLSINNFACSKPADKTERSNFASPAQNCLEKKRKREEKRPRTHAEEQLLELAHSLSPAAKKLQPRRERKEAKKSVVRQRSRKSQEGTERSPLRGYEASDFLGRTPSKLHSVVKKKSVQEKLSSAVGSLKNIHRVKTGSRNNLTSLSGLHY